MKVFHNDRVRTANERALAIWATMDQLLGKAASLRDEAKELEEKAKALDTLASDIADGRL